MKPTPGFFSVGMTSEYFSNDSSTTWFLVRNHHHLYMWQKAKCNKPVSHAVDVGTEITGNPLYLGRAYSNGSYFYGPVSTTSDGLWYIDPEGNRRLSEKYDVLTCRSHICKVSSNNNFIAY